MKYKIKFFSKIKYDYYLVINVYNEGKRLHKFLSLIENNKKFGVLIADSPSNDGSTNEQLLSKYNVDILLSMNFRSDHTKTLLAVSDFFFNIDFKGIVIVDGNGKDIPSFTYDFINKLKDGYDYIQGSRYLTKDMAINIPILRSILIRTVHAPLMSIACRKKFTDTTNGFRAISSRFLKENYLFIKSQNLKFYEFYFYTCYLACRKNYKTCEIPVKREYDKKILVTKITSLKLYWNMLKPPLFQALGIKYRLK
tara:strand:+ start:158 stop:916 length:759 start_codon:yes stop_codon:yes gene_type:complete